MKESKKKNNNHVHSCNVRMCACVFWRHVDGLKLRSLWRIILALSLLHHEAKREERERNLAGVLVNKVEESLQNI